jgi:siderophore synthetase component
MAAVGLAPSLTATHDLMPVHPLTARRALAAALAEAGLATPGTMIAPAPWLPVRPALSTGTVAVTGYPGARLKLPLPASILGSRQCGTLAPAALADGALVHRVLAGITARDPGLRGLLLTDDSDFAHAGHPCLGYLLRRLPRHLDQHRIVPVGALLAPSSETGTGLVIDDLARDGFGGEPVAFFGAYLDQLFDIGVRLFARYGIALESHQQNAAVVVGPGGSPPRLLVKGFGGALLNHDRLTAGLGPATPDPSQFAGHRLLTGSDDALAGMFITMTVHLCAGAIAFGLAERGYATQPELLALVRGALTAALDRHDDSPAARLLRARVLAPDRLPGPAMVTGGMLRGGTRDISRFRGATGPNYLAMSCLPLA